MLYCFKSIKRSEIVDSWFRAAATDFEFCKVCEIQETPSTEADFAWLVNILNTIAVNLLFS